MRRAHRWLLLAFVAGCGGEASSPQRSDAQVESKSTPASLAVAAPIKITVDRSECYGWCPNYELVIEGDGRVRYTGRSFVRDIGQRESRISEAATRDLVDQFEAAHFFELKNEYSQLVTDCPTTILTLQIGNRTKQVLNYWGGAWPRHQPEDLEIHETLDALAAAVDRAANIEQWVGTSTEREALARSRREDGLPGRTKVK